MLVAVPRVDGARTRRCARTSTARSTPTRGQRCASLPRRGAPDARLDELMPVLPPVAVPATTADAGAWRTVVQRVRGRMVHVPEGWPASADPPDGAELQPPAQYTAASRHAHLRLEPLSGEADADLGLRAEVGDPAWALARQWQLGEHQGENAASPVSYWILARHTRLLPPTDRPFADPVAVPGEAVLEAAVEDWQAPGAADPWNTTTLLGGLDRVGGSPEVVLGKMSNTGGLTRGIVRETRACSKGAPRWRASRRRW